MDIISIVIIVVLAVIACALVVAVIMRALKLSDKVRELNAAKENLNRNKSAKTYGVDILQQNGKVSIVSENKIDVARDVREG